ncbi:hypothetical protein GCM10027436_17940 [Actinophytocola sediminis]
MGELGLASQAGLVTQRLKRFESIVAKLVRSQTRLGEMEDIAGCRTVLPDLEAVARVHEQLAQAARKRAEMVEEWDSALRLDLKHETGPDVVLNYFRLLADYYFGLDSGVANSNIDVSPLKTAEDELVVWLKEVDHG